MSAAKIANRRRQAPSDRCGSIFRIYIGGNAIVSWFVSMTDPRSLMHPLASSADGSTLMWLLMIAGVAAVVDAVINDLLPERFHWRVALRQRHFILAAMAFCYVGQLYVAFFYLRSTGLLPSTGLLLYYLWNASAIMLVAFIDANQRSRDATCGIICN